MESAQGFEKIRHAVKADSQGFIAAAVAQADVALGAKAASGHGGDLGLLDHPGAEFRGAQAEFFNAGEYVEGTHGLREGETHFPQAAADVVSALLVDPAHGFRVGFQGRHGGVLKEGRHGGDGCSAEQEQPVHDVIRAGEVPDAPSGHGVGLGEALTENHLVL